LANPDLWSSNEQGLPVTGKQKQMFILSSGAHAPGQSSSGQGRFSRVVAAASVGLCFVGGIAAAPAHASHRHHSETGKSGKAEAPKQPTGPLLLAISIGGQRVTVYDDGTPIASSPISTGMSGHLTPMGVFSVIQKQRWHRSNLYSNAPMPYMQRITWSGVALHAGVVPGYPASHGCIRLPEGFAVRLWGMTRLGARVIIARGDAAPYEINHPRLAGLVKPPETDAAPNSAANSDDAKPDGARVLPRAVVLATTSPLSPLDSERAAPAYSGHAESEPGTPASPQAAGTSGPANGEPATVEQPPTPKAEPEPPSKVDEALQRPGQLSLFVSRRERKLFVRKGFTPAFDVPVTIEEPEKPLGTHVFTASRPANEQAGVRWLAVSLGYDRPPASGSGHGKRKGRTERPAPATAASLHQSAVDALNRVELPPEALARIAPLVGPGTSLVISDQGLGGETGKDTDFIVVTK
jgi:L,D-transpeptidase catalytic domain